MVVRFKAKSFILFFLLFSSFQLAFASEIKVRRNAPATVKFGEIFQVNITVENLGSMERRIIVEELVSNFEPIEPKPISIEPNESGPIFVPPPFFRWEFSLEARGSRTVYYKARPLAPGDLMLSPTKVYWEGGTIYTDPLLIKVVCNQNGICELDKENYLTCPEDCPSGSKDNYCDGARDGICDPDCEISGDEDCICNQNGICEGERGENSGNCLVDCHCGNGLCEDVFEENPKSCPSDCIAMPLNLSFLLYPLAGIILISLLLLLILRTRREKESRLSLPY